MKTLTTVALIAALLATQPASALTLQQAQAELAGMYCSGSTCTSSTPGTRTEPGAPIVQGGYSEAKSAKQRQGDDAYFDCGFPMTFGEVVSIGGVPTCVPGSMIGSGSTSPAVVGYQPGTTVGTVTTTTKELVYNGPNTDRANAWSINTTVTTTDAP